MRTLVLSIFVMLMLAIAAMPSAHAACTVRDNGIDYVDSDCDMIRDLDDMSNPVDNCPNHPNGNCDADPLNCDVDGNGLTTDAELAAGEQLDWNHNDIGDACDDADLDTVPDYLDNCRSKFNQTQGPLDCTDTDNDRIEDEADNCVNIWNPSQLNSDTDSFGDACDVCRYVDNEDQDKAACPYEPPSVTPSETSKPNPNPGIEVGQAPEHVEGSGGCAIVGTEGVAPLALMLLIASLAAIVGVRKR